MKLLCISAILALCPLGAAVAGDNGGMVAFPVLKVTVYPGDTITEEMLTQKLAVPLAGPASLVTDKLGLPGKVARRTLLANQPIPRNAIREPYAVLQGKTVPLTFQSGNILITGVAVPLESGSAGEIIPARNPESGIVVRCTVQADGSLRAQ